MATLSTSAEAVIDAPADLVLEILRDFDGHHRRILPPAFSDFEVEQGGHGHGTMTRFKFKLGGRTTENRTLVSETEPGVIREQILDRDMVTTSRVVADGSGSRVSFSTVWTPFGGINGLLERVFAPSMLRRIYVQELALLADYARSLASTAAAPGAPDASAAATPPVPAPAPAASGGESR